MIINGDLDMFIDTIYYGEDISIKYGNIRLFIDGWWKDNKYTLRMFNYDNPDEDSIYNFEITNVDRQKSCKWIFRKEDMEWQNVSRRSKKYRMDRWILI